MTINKRELSGAHSSDQIFFYVEITRASNKREYAGYDLLAKVPSRYGFATEYASPRESRGETRGKRQKYERHKKYGAEW